MRVGPTLVTSGFSWAAASPAGNQIGFYNNAISAWTTLTGAVIPMLAATAGPSAVMLRLLAGVSFNGAVGSTGILHIGSAAFIALQAEL